LAESLQFVNENYFKANILLNISRLCYDENNKINEVEKYDLSLQGTSVVASIQGKTFDAKAECVLKINPELLLNAEKVSFNLVDEEEVEGEEEDVDTEDEDSENETIEDTTENGEELARDPNVEQFPINLEKALPFTSESR
jgi:hypothetical protein